MEQELKQALSRRHKSRIVNTSRISAAILLPMYRKQGEHYLLFTKRTEEVKNHKGQISFPGGAYEEQDGTLANTALRECAEEIGLPAEAIELPKKNFMFVVPLDRQLRTPFASVLDLC